MHLSNPYGLLRCFTRCRASFLSLWSLAQLREPVGVYGLEGLRSTWYAEPHLRVVLHLRSSGFEERASQRRPDAFPSASLCGWVLGTDRECSNTTMCHCEEQRSAVCQMCRILRRDTSSQPVHWLVMHDGTRNARHVRDRLVEFIERNRGCGHPMDRVTDLSSDAFWKMIGKVDAQKAQHLYARLLTEMNIAIHDAHIFVGSTLSTVSSNIARWRAYSRQQPAPSLSYTGDKFLRSIPNMLGFH